MSTIFHFQLSETICSVDVGLLSLVPLLPLLLVAQKTIATWVKVSGMGGPRRESTRLETNAVSSVAWQLTKTVEYVIACLNLCYSSFVFIVLSLRSNTICMVCYCTSREVCGHCLVRPRPSCHSAPAWEHSHPGGARFKGRVSSMLLSENYLELPLRSLHCLEAHIVYFTWNHSFTSYTSWISTHTGAKTMADPLRSATANANIDDTSLAVPTDNKLRTGQQRVLDQVHTIKRSKSKQGKSGTVSPASMNWDYISILHNYFDLLLV